MPATLTGAAAALEEYWPASGDGEMAAPKEGDGATAGAPPRAASQSERGGVETAQEEGRARALVMLILIPMAAPWLKATQRQLSCSPATFLSPEQHRFSGRASLLP